MSTRRPSAVRLLGVRSDDEVAASDSEALGWVLALEGGGLSADQERDFQAWMEASPNHRDRFAALMAAWDASACLAQPSIVAELTPATLHPGNHSMLGVRRRRRWLAAGASVAAGFTAIALIVTVPASNDVKPVELVTQPGERMERMLPDGSRISLSGATRVSYAISEDRRELALSSGEAYFDVVRDGRPFQVRTPAGVVDVIGTAFNLDVVDTRTTQVAVYHGRVAVDSGAARLQIAQGEQVDLTAGAPLVRRALEGDGPDWRDGWFEARDESLIRVLQETSRFSPLPIEVGDPALASIHLSGRLRVAEPERVLAMLERAHGLRIRREPARIVLLPADAERQP